jgi:3-hydroxyisobutyryl-CoA hydrolase
MDMVSTIDTYFESILNNPPERIILEGAGNSFCAGGDIKELYAHIVNNELQKPIDFYKVELGVDYTVSRLSSRVISLWNGYVAGGGAGLSINSGIRIATENTIFTMPECHIGLFPDVGASYFLPRLLNSYEIALYVGLTGYRFVGVDALNYGIATHFIQSDKLDALKQDIINSEDDMGVILERNGCLSKVDGSFTNKEFIEKAFVLDSIESIYKQLGEMVNSNSLSEQLFATNTIKTLEKVSAISMTIFLECLKRSKDFKSIKDAYELDYEVFEK